MTCLDQSTRSNLLVMTETLDLTTMHPSEIDTLLFPLWAKRYEAAFWKMQAERYAERDKAYWQKWRDEHDGQESYNERSHNEQIAKYQDMIDEANAAIEPLQLEYHRRGGWTRYDFVPDGHLHFFHCHTLRPTTTRLLVAEASGQTAEWIVEHFAYAACTFCFPDAPVEAREEYLRDRSNAAKAKRAEEKAAREAKKAEKNLVERVVIQEESSRFTARIETVYAAKQWLKGYVEWAYIYDHNKGGRTTAPGERHPSYPDAGAEQIRAALRLKGIDPEPLEAKWAKQVAREYR